MKATIFTVLLIMFTLFLSVTTASAANHETVISCTNIDNPSFENCTGIEQAELRGLVGNFENIKECKDSLIEAGGVGSCTVGQLTCDIANNEAGGSYSASCTVEGVPSTVYALNCGDINTTTNEATCAITNEIAGLVDVISDVNGNVAPLLTPPEFVFANTMISTCSRSLIISDALQNDCAILISLISAAETDPAAAARAAALLDVITPSAASAAIDASQTSLRAQNRNISQRMNLLRRAGLALKEEVSFNGLQIRSNGKLVDLSNTYPELKPVTGGAASANSSSKGRLGVFLNGTADMGDKDNSANERGFSFSGSDLTLGVDYVTSNASFIGMAFGMSTSSATLNDARGSLDNTGYNLIVYASIMPITGMYVDSNILIGGNNFDQKRRMIFDSTDGLNNPVSIDKTASATYFGDQFAASVTLGYDYVNRAITMSPYATVQILKSSTDDYNESISGSSMSGAGLALRIDEQDYQSTTMTIGSQFSYVVNLRSGVLIPQIRLEWIKEFQDDVNVVSGNFIGDPLKEKFRLPTDKPDDSYVQLGVGTTGIIPGGTTYYAFYQTFLGYENLSQSSLNFGLRWEL